MHHLTLTSWAKAREKLDDTWHVSTYKDAETCYQEKNYDKENKEKITKNRNMVRSDALPTELRRTCLHVELNFKVMFFGVLSKDQA